MVPRTANLMSVGGRPGRLVLAEVIAARSDPGPASLSRRTVRVRAYAGGGFEWWPGRAPMAPAPVATAADTAPPYISPEAADTGRDQGNARGPGRARSPYQPRGTKWPFRAIVPRRERAGV